MVSVEEGKDIESNKHTAKNSEIVSSNPSVTIGIPVFNEEEHIERVISSFLDSKYSNLIEILIADGGSEDKTREIVKNLSKKDSRVKLIDNKERFQSFGLNKMIKVAQGEIFLRADAHCYYQEDYVERCITTILKTKAKNVGGAQRYKASNYVQAGIALAVKGFLGNGGAKYMNENYEGYADTVFLGCFWTEDLRDIGGFNTENITNQDSELNLRLIENFGESVFISPEIKSWYYPRDSFRKLFKQYFRYGRGRFLTRSLHPKGSPLRGLMPFLFLLLLSFYVIMDLVMKENLYSLLTLCVLAILVFFESFRIVLSNTVKFKKEIWQEGKNPPNFIFNLLTAMTSLVIMQFGHFFGFLFQLVKSRLGEKKGW